MAPMDIFKTYDYISGGTQEYKDQSTGIVSGVVVQMVTLQSDSTR